MKQQLLILTLLVLTFSFGAKNVLVIESYNAAYEWDADYLSGLKSTLGTAYNVTNFEMDTKRIPPSEFQNMADKAWKLVETSKPDYIVIGDDNALKYLAPKITNNTPPVIFLGINGSLNNYGVVGKKNVTGILERPLFQSSIMGMTSILPNLKGKALILFDDGTTSKEAVNSIFNNNRTLQIAGLTVSYKQIGNIDTWKETINNADKAGYDFIIIGLYQTIKDSNNKHVNADDVLAWTSINSKVPLFGFWLFSVGKGKTIGGLVLEGVSQGNDVAEMIKKIDAGMSPADIRPLAGKKGHLLFSKSELSRWKFSLPENMAKSAIYLE